MSYCIIQRLKTNEEKKMNTIFQTDSPVNKNDDNDNTAVRPSFQLAHDQAGQLVSVVVFGPDLVLADNLLAWILLERSSSRLTVRQRLPVISIIRLVCLFIW